MTPKDLRSRRLALGITVGELSEEVRLPAKLVAAIENGDEPIEQPEVFLRAFERIQARFQPMPPTQGPRRKHA